MFTDVTYSKPIPMKNVFVVFTALGLLVGSQAFSQYFGMNASIFEATGDFNRNVNNNPAGLSLNYVHSLNKLPALSIGAEAGVAMYSNKTYDIQTVDHGTVSIYEEDCFWTVHLLAQYAVYSTNTTTVYAEGRTGITTFFSSKMAEDDDSAFDDEFKFHGSAFNTGFGGGVKLNLSGLYKKDSENHKKIWLDVAVTANSGSRTNYRNATSDTKSLSEANYTSLTNYLHYRIGIAYRIGS
jgi:hypothetical protein